MYAKAMAFVLWTMAVLAPAPAMAGCTALSSAEYDMGVRTTGQAAAGTSQGYDAPAGLRCSGVLLSLLSSNRADAKVHSVNGFLLKSDAGRSVSYVASPLADGSRPIPQDGTVNYADPALLALLTLGSAKDYDLPISFLRFKGSGLDGGVYRDTLHVDWDWRVCDGISLLNTVCLFYSQGRARTTINITMTIVDRRPVVTITTRTVRDPINGVGGPKAIPGATVTSTVVVTNPDVVPLDPDSVSVSIPVPDGMAPDVASDDAVKLGEGSQMSLVYASATSRSDDVDFACGAGSIDYACAPASGFVVTAIRTRLKGSLGPGETVTVTVRYTVI
jgi:hypothetical protein